MTKKTEENKEKSKISEKKRILYEIVEESTIPKFKIVGALAKAGLLQQYTYEEKNYGIENISPSITQSEFDKIIKNFLG